MIINRTDLLKAIEKVSPGLATSKEVIAQTASIIFLDNKIATYNDEVAVSLEYNGVDFTGAVPGKELINLLNKVKDSELDINATMNELKVSGKKFNASIRLETEINLPINSLKTGKFHPLPTDFVEALKFVLFNAGKDMSKPILTCVHGSGNTLTACDNMRATMYRMDNVLIEPMLLPATSVKKLVDYNITHVSINDRWAHFQTKCGCLFSCRIWEGDYPKERISKIMNLEDTHTINFPRDMIGILERAFLTAREGDPGVKITVSDGEIRVKGENSISSYEEFTRVRSEKDNFSFSINPIFLTQILLKVSEASLNDSKIKFCGDRFDHIIPLGKEDDRDKYKKEGK